MTTQELLQQALPLHQAGRLEEAKLIYDQVLGLEPANWAALHLMGLLRLQQSRVHEALVLMEAALKAKPGAPETLSNYAMALSELGRNAEALAALEGALRAQPNNDRTLTNRGAIKAKLGQPEAALEDFDRAVALNGRNVDALNNRGLMQQGLKRYEQALASFDSLLALVPDYFEGRNNRGLVLRELGRDEEALAEFDRVIAQVPSHVGAHVNRANILWRQERLDEALDAYGKALAINPDLPEALESRASLLWTRKQALAPAIADLERALAVSPELPYVQGMLLHLKMHAGDWRDYRRDKARLDGAVRAGKPAAMPFVYQGLSDSLSDLESCAVTYASREYPLAGRMMMMSPRRPGPIRIGYLCGEFRAQATMYLAAGLFESHDRSRFEVLAFDAGRDDASPMRKRVVAAFDKFISITSLSDRDAAARIAAEEVDILVNLNGYFGKMRPGVFALRPAPIQVNYLGFPGTMGADYMDYILADAVLIGEDEHRYYRERVVTLPGSYQINDSKRAQVGITSRAEHGLPQDKFVLCHFNYGYKVTPDLFACWMRILQAVDGSVLWLLAGDPLFAENLRREAAEAGVDASRLIFAPPMKLEAHLARLPLGDLFLDAIVSGAHTTASDALWAGLPLLAHRGNSFSGRVAASLLNAAGLPELVTETLEDYEALAVKLAGDAPLLKRYRHRLAETRATAPLFDTVRTTRHIEAAYEKMQALKQNGEAPESFAIAPL
ncbi:MAG TPA: tetratricopeptide repeat protein [Rhizomicrobium sp.]|nr:tetratricopeptide repeat protein [Rhizomicrobium sp.]